MSSASIVGAAGTGPWDWIRIRSKSAQSTLMSRGQRWVLPSLVGLAVLLSAIFAGEPVTKRLQGKPNKDYPLWYRTGRLYAQGASIYPREPGVKFPFMYPPSAAAMLAIGSQLGETGMLAGLLALNLSAWVAAAVLSVRLSAGPVRDRNPLLLLLPSLMVVPLIHNTFMLGQPNLLLLALMLGTFAASNRGRPWLAGGFLALAAGIKAFPILALGYFVWRREWKVVATTLLSLVLLLAVLPLAFRTPAQAASDFQVWGRGMVLKYDEGGIAQRPERSWSFKNQSLVAVVTRLTRDVPANGEAHDGWRVNLADLSFRGANLLVLSLIGALCLTYVLAMPPRAALDCEARATEQAMLLILILAFSPLSFNYFFVWLIFPLTVFLAGILRSAPGTPARLRGFRALTVLIGLLALSIPFPMAAQGYGNLLAVALMTFAWLARDLRRLGRPTGPPLGIPERSGLVGGTLLAAGLSR